MLEKDLIAKFSEICYNSCKLKETASNEARSNHNIIKRFGIGTFLTCDLPVDPLNVVFKMIECNGKPVCKLSNNRGKIMCRDNEYVNYLEKTIDWRLKYED